MKLSPIVIDDLTIPVPIIQGGMGIGVSLSGLASAVAKAGGVGVIATAGIGWAEQDVKKNYLEANSRALCKEIRKARQATNGVLGVNIMVALSNFPELVAAAAEEGIDIIFSGAGLPLSLPKYLPEGSKTKLFPIVSSARAADLICRTWKRKFDRLPDAIVVEGPKAGGHLGFKPEQISDPAYALENLIPEVVEVIKPYREESGKPIPVIAAGGVYTGQDIFTFLELGASGVQMGTRFVATHECDAAHEFKQAFLDARKEDITIIKSPVGLPGRALRNKFVQDMEQGSYEPFVCPYHCIRTCEHTKSPFCIALALLNARRGSLGNGLAFAGANAYRVDEIISVEELMGSLVEEYEMCYHN